MINSPNTNDEFGTLAPAYEISINDPHLDKIWYTLDGGLTNITTASVSGPINEAIWEGISEGPVTIRFYANDTLGNIDYNEVTVIKSVPAKDSDNFWNDLMQQGLLIPIVGAVVGGIIGIAFFIIKRKLKKKGEKVGVAA